MKNTIQTKNKSKGFTLIEVLVSLLVLAIGLLGIVGLQNVALRHNQTAYFESQATFLAYDILDRMRANKNTGAYATALTEAANAPATQCDTSNCSITQMATWDKSEWKQLITNNLPEGRGAVTFNGDDVIITVEYGTPDDAGNPKRSFVMRTQL